MIIAIYRTFGVPVYTRRPSYKLYAIYRTPRKSLLINVKASK